MRVGIDLGGTNIAVGIVDSDYRILAKHSIPTLAQRPYQGIVKDMASAVRQALELAHISLEDCDGIGIGSPGACNMQTGVVVYSNNISWNNVPVCEELRRYLPLPTALSNDANCAALGEVLAGAAMGCASAVLLTLGTGVGGGIIIDGKIYAGVASAGAELGHTLLLLDGEECTCGRKGCLEAYASATALIRQTRRAALAHPESTLAKISPEQINGRSAFDAMRAGDPAAQAVVETYIRYLSAGITDMVNIFRPEAVILGGGICHEGETLLAPIRNYISEHAFGGAAAPQPLLTAAALGNDAGIIGAAMLDLP